MKHKWFKSTLGAVALLLGTTWTQGHQAYAVGFEPPAENSAPRDSVGGASRGSFFEPAPDNNAPRESTGGSSRSGFFTPASDNSAPSESTGGASRGEFFEPAPGNSAPSESTGGASRGEFFEPAPGNSAPSDSAGGASRSEFFTPVSDGAPSETISGRSGGARSNVYGVTNSVTIASMLAVTPDSFYGTTLEARPTIMVYVPASNANEAIFSLKSEDKNLVYQMTLAVPSGGGVLAITLPAEAPELTIDQNYQWYLAMKLDNELSPASPFVDGWVKRISPSAELASNLAKGEGLADVAELGANGIWYDTVAQLAMLNEAEASDEMAGHWYELLESVGLAEIAAAPVAL